MLDFEFIRDNWFFIASGIGETLVIAIFSFLLATPIAMIVSRGRRSTVALFNRLSVFYVWLMDGIPLLLLIYFIFLALPQLGIFLPGLFGAGVTAMTVYYGARISKIFYERFAFTVKNPGETRLSFFPVLANELASMIKDSALISVTGFIHDVMWRAIRVGRADFKNFEALLIAAIIYLLLIASISLGTKLITGRITAAEAGITNSV